MNHKSVLSLLLAAAVLCGALLGCGGKEDPAVEAVRRQLSALHTSEQFRSMDEAERLDAYNRTQTAYDAYMALSEGQKQQLPEAEAIFEDLFTYFNNQIMPLQ